MKNTYKPRARTVAIDTRVWDLFSVALMLSLTALACFWCLPR